MVLLCYAILASHHHSFLRAPVFCCAPLLLNFHTTAHFLKNIHFRQLPGNSLCLRQKDHRHLLFFPQKLWFILCFHYFMDLVTFGQIKAPSKRDAVQAEQNYLRWNLLLMVDVFVRRYFASQLSNPPVWCGESPGLLSASSVPHYPISEQQSDDSDGRLLLSAWQDSLGPLSATLFFVCVAHGWMW